jgi:hypothetical protein
MNVMIERRTSPVELLWDLVFVFADASWSVISGFAATVLVGMALPVLGSLWGGWPLVLLWTAAVAIGLELIGAPMRGMPHQIQ